MAQLPECQTRVSRQHPGGDRLKFVHRPLHLRHHRRRRQI